MRGGAAPQGTALDWIRAYYSAIDNHILLGSREHIENDDDNRAGLEW